MESICSQCEKTFGTVTLLDMHQRFCKSKPIKPSNLQNKVIKEEVSYKINNHGPQENDRLICEHCDK